MTAEKSYSKKRAESGR